MVEAYAASEQHQHPTDTAPQPGAAFSVETEIQMSNEQIRDAAQWVQHFLVTYLNRLTVRRDIAEGIKQNDELLSLLAYYYIQEGADSPMIRILVDSQIDGDTARSRQHVDSVVQAILDARPAEYQRIADEIERRSFRRESFLGKKLRKAAHTLMFLLSLSSATSSFASNSSTANSVNIQGIENVETTPGAEAILNNTERLVACQALTLSLDGNELTGRPLDPKSLDQLADMKGVALTGAYRLTQEDFKTIAEVELSVHGKMVEGFTEFDRKAKMYSKTHKGFDAAKAAAYKQYLTESMGYDKDAFQIAIDYIYEDGGNLAQVKTRLYEVMGKMQAVKKAVERIVFAAEFGTAKFNALLDPRAPEEEVFKSLQKLDANNTKIVKLISDSQGMFNYKVDWVPDQGGEHAGHFNIVGENNVIVVQGNINPGTGKVDYIETSTGKVIGSIYMQRATQKVIDNQPFAAAHMYSQDNRSWLERALSCVQIRFGLNINASFTNSVWRDQVQWYQKQIQYLQQNNGFVWNNTIDMPAEVRAHNEWVNNTYKRGFDGVVNTQSEGYKPQKKDSGTSPVQLSGVSADGGGGFGRSGAMNKPN